MSLKRNAISNYIGQGYTVLIGVAITPLYLQYLGAEAYGLVGFFTLMHAWLYLLDLGLTPTLGRQVAYARGQGEGFDSFRRLLKSFEVIFFTIALVTVVVIFFSSEWIVLSWIKAESLEPATMIHCVLLMGVMVGLRWFTGLYRSGINGMEDQVWLNIASITIVSLKFIGALLLLIFVTQDIRHFFEYQLCIGVFELAIISYRFYWILPPTKNRLSLVLFDWVAVKAVMPFCLSIAYTAGVWVVITQTDKLILSGVLSLADFGYFSLVALIAGAVTAVSGPISLAATPKMTLLLSQGKHSEMLVVYRQASQAVAVMALSVSLVICVYAEPLIYAWTGNLKAAEWGSDVLTWFVLGNGVLAIGAFQYYLQSAFGQLRLHVIGSTISAFTQVPIIYFSAVNYGAEGAGMAWFGFRLFWFLCWTPVIHRHFLPGFHYDWMIKDIAPIIGTTILLAVGIDYFSPIYLVETRLILFIKMISIGFVMLILASLSAKTMRETLFKKISSVL